MTTNTNPPPSGLSRYNMARFFREVPMTELYHAQLDWDAQGQPLSRQFADVYFSRTDGLGETRHVFLAGNQLTERFSAMKPEAQLVIGETGFGTGLNFLCTWQLFNQTAPAGARLHFISVEKYPLSSHDLCQALRLWPELTAQATALQAQYVAVHPGFQTFTFEQGRIRLTLLVGEAQERLAQLQGQIDAWFLDGFAPAKNPQMWTPELFAQLARLSAPGASLGTFTSAGFVRRGLQDVGFTMQRVSGYGRKREILRGKFPTAHPTSSIPPWYEPAPLPAGPRQAIVIGAGLAGCATAASLAQRGWQVTLLEQHGNIAQEGSGNPQGMLYLKLSAHGTALSQLIMSGFGYTRRLLQQLPSGSHWAPCGLLQLAMDERTQQRQQQLAEHFPATLLHPLDATQATHQAGIPLTHGGLLFPEAGWLQPAALCRQLLQQPGITLQTNHKVLQLQHHQGRWQALGADAKILASAPVMVLANAASAQQLTPAEWLPLKRIRGQTTCLSATPGSRHLRMVVCGEGYIAPAYQNQHTLGATFNFSATDLQPNPREHGENLDQLAALSAPLHQALGAEHQDLTQLQGHVAFRCTSPDYLPLVGPLADPSAFRQAYGVLAKDARQQPDIPCPWLPGLYVNTGHGSRGLITAPLCGELLAAWITKEPLPVTRAVAHGCHPNRFLLRQLIRGQ